MQTVMSTEAPAALPDHLIASPGNEWAFWRCVCLRSAGFPAEDIFKLAAPPEFVQAVDRVIVALQQAEIARKQALAQINGALDALRANGKWDDKKLRKSLLKAKSKVNGMEVSRSSPELTPEIAAGLKAALQQVEIERAEFHRTFSRLAGRTSEVVREIAGSPRFREAVTWQNPTAVKTALDSLLRQPLNGAPPSSRQKQHEELVASYWQRYCIKNDTIGFFGPVGWARYASEVQHLEVRAHEPLVRARKTYWEAWAMEA